MKIALVIGGTGMLAELTKKLSQEYDFVGVVGRNQSKLRALSEVSKKIIPLQSDYADLPAFATALTTFANEYGRPELVVSWIHSTSPDAPLIAARVCAQDFYDITGHSGKDASHISRVREKDIAKITAYHRIILGCTSDGWLSDHQISAGVYEAITSGKHEFVVGSL